MSPFFFPYSFWVSSPKILSPLGGFLFCPIFTWVTLVNMMLKISEQSLHPGWWIFAQTSWCTLPQQNCKPLLERKGKDLAHSVAALCSSAANRSLPCWTLSCHSFSSRSGPHQQVSIIQSTSGTQSPTLMAWGIIIKQLVGRTVWCLSMSGLHFNEIRISPSDIASLTRCTLEATWGLSCQGFCMRPWETGSSIQVCASS